MNRIAPVALLVGIGLAVSACTAGFPPRPPATAPTSVSAAQTHLVTPSVREEPITREAVEGAWIPAMCDRPGGKLQGGALPDRDADGSIRITELASGGSAFARWSDLEGRQFAAVVLDCGAQGVTHRVLAIVRAPDKIVSHIDVADVRYGSPGDAWEFIERDGGVELAYESDDGVDPDDPEFRDHVVRFDWNGVTIQAREIDDPRLVEEAVLVASALADGDQRTLAERLAGGSGQGALARGIGNAGGSEFVASRTECAEADGQPVLDLSVEGASHVCRSVAVGGSFMAIVTLEQVRVRQWESLDVGIYPLN